MEQDDDEKVVLDKLETLQHAHNELEVRYLKELRELQKKYQTIFSYNYNQRYKFDSIIKRHETGNRQHLIQRTRMG